MRVPAGTSHLPASRCESCVLPCPQNATDDKRKAADAAIESVLFKEAVTKKELARRALEKAAAKVAKEKPKEPDKRDIYSDARDAKNDDDMSTWDDAKLQEVVNQKKGGQGERCKTDIICRHFLEAVEKRTYGWFWECPNGGDKCQYRHALPEGYVLKRDKVDEVVDEGPKIEDIIEEERKALGPGRTPVTFERLQEWLAKKKAAQAEAEAAELETARKEYAKGKRSGVTGRMLFSIDASLFVDDAAAGEDRYVREESDDEEGDGDGPSSAAGAATSAPRDPNSGAAAGIGVAAPSAAEVEPAYAQNYAAGTSASVGCAAAATSSALAADFSAADLEGVDESLFLDEDLPEDDELEELA